MSKEPAVIVTTPPVIVRGTGFKPRENVAVTVRARRWARKQVVASSRGVFTVRFQRLNSSGCAGLWVVAVGNRDSRAGYSRSPGLCPLP
jgi:hypothetical protein